MRLQSMLICPTILERGHPKETQNLEVHLLDHHVLHYLHRRLLAQNSLDEVLFLDEANVLEQLNHDAILYLTNVNHFFVMPVQFDDLSQEIDEKHPMILVGNLLFAHAHDVTSNILILLQSPLKLQKLFGIHFLLKN